jgi:hypothetical protein
MVKGNTMLFFYGLSSQNDHLNQVQGWLKSKGIDAEIKFTDLNEEAQKHLTQLNYTIQPVLFHLDAIGITPTKFAEGGEIMNMTDDQVANIVKLIEADPK